MGDSYRLEGALAIRVCREEVARKRVGQLLAEAPVLWHIVRERFVEERSIRDIATRLNKTEGAVKQLQFRALQALRTKIEGADV